MLYITSAIQIKVTDCQRICDKFCLTETKKIYRIDFERNDFDAFHNGMKQEGDKV